MKQLKQAGDFGPLPDILKLIALAHSQLIYL